MKMFSLYFLISSLWIFSFLCHADSGLAEGSYKTGADDHAPIFVMGDHNHKAGEWMFSLRYSQRVMKDYFEGSKKVSTEEIFKSNYIMVPTSMFVSMYMGGMMYGLSDNLTIMFMASFISKRMSMIHSPKETSSQSGKKTDMKSHQMKTKARPQMLNKEQEMGHDMFSQGFGDIKISGLFTLYESSPGPVSSRPRHKFLFESGLGFPTGSITKGKKTGYSYSMQLGSGSIDPLVSLVYVFKQSDWSLGAQSRHVFRFMNNKLNYRLGREDRTTAWLAYNLLQQISISCRLEYGHWGNIRGENKELDKKSSPASRADLRAGRSVKASMGLNLYQNQGPLSGNRLGFEFGMPLYQNLTGPQMGLNHYIMLGWQLAL